MKILIAGSHGMLGSALARHLTESSHEVVCLVRRTPNPGELWWDPEAGQIDAAGLCGFDGVVQLASMPWPMRWTANAKQTMLANRLGGNRLLAESLAACERKPSVLICASGMGYYPPCGDAPITEECPAGTSFLAGLQQAGEAATAPASAAGIRVVHLRIPPVLGGAALQRPSISGGNGQQWASWIGRDELAAIIEFALKTGSLSGPVNATSPNPLRYADFALCASRILGRRPGFNLPAWLVRLLLGEMGVEFILASRRMLPAKLLAAGYQFRFPELEQTLRHELGKLNETTARPSQRPPYQDRAFPV